MATNIIYRNSTNPTVPSSTIAKGTPLTSNEIDGNFKSIQNTLDHAVIVNSNGFLNIIETTSSLVTTPSAGSINLFVEGGILKFKNSAGSILTITSV